MKLSAEALAQSMIDFEASLRPVIAKRAGQPIRTMEVNRAKRLLVLLNSERTPANFRRMKRLHDRAVKWAAENGGKVRRNGAIDWSQFPWKEVLTAFLSFIGVLLPIILR